jgi:hypothetical protein
MELKRKESTTTDIITDMITGMAIDAYNPQSVRLIGISAWVLVLSTEFLTQYTKNLK